MWLITKSVTRFIWSCNPWRNVPSAPFSLHCFLSSHPNPLILWREYSLPVIPMIRPMVESLLMYTERIVISHVWSFLHSVENESSLKYLKWGVSITCLYQGKSCLHCWTEPFSRISPSWLPWRYCNAKFFEKEGLNGWQLLGADEAQGTSPPWKDTIWGRLFIYRYFSFWERLWCTRTKLLKGWMDENNIYRMNHFHIKVFHDVLTIWLYELKALACFHLCLP